MAGVEWGGSGWVNARHTVISKGRRAELSGATKPGARLRNLPSDSSWAVASPALALSSRCASEGVDRAAASTLARAEGRFLGPATVARWAGYRANGPRNGGLQRVPADANTPS